MKTTDTELVEDFQRGDVSAFDELVERYGKKVFSYVYRMLGDYHESEDAFQDVFTRIYATIKSFRGRASFSTWLFTVARNTCLDKLRRRKVGRFIDRFRVGGGTSEPVCGRKQPDQLVLEKDTRKTVLEAVGFLPPDQKEVVILKYGVGFTFREISEITGVSESTAKSRMVYALDKMRYHLKAAGIGETI